MQDRKALQSGTSHFLGQNFAHASGIKFLDQQGQEQFAYTTSWGVSTRLIGALVMVHSDDDGFIVPPRLAPVQVVILPILHDDETRDSILEYCEKLKIDLKSINYHGHPIEVELDKRDIRGGQKFWDWVKMGVPLRIEIGSREVESDMLSVGRRDREHRERKNISRSEFIATITEILDDIQRTYFVRAREFRERNLVRIDSKEEFYQFFTQKNQDQPEIHGGFALSHWNGDPGVEEKVKEELGVTIRCIPLNTDGEEGRCVITGEPSKGRVIFAKAY